MTGHARNLILILGDQLSPTMSSLQKGDPAKDRVIMAELAEEAGYVGHHKKKIAFIFSAMRHFAEELRALGWSVDYVKFDQEGNGGTFASIVQNAVAQYAPQRLVVTESGEWRVAEMFAAWCQTLGIPVEILPDERFICSIEEFARWAEGRKQLRMEYFYRVMRRKTGLLMDGEGPAGGQWNFDAENRKPPRDDLFMPEPLSVPPGAMTQEVIALVSAHFSENFGEIEPFALAVTRANAEAAFTKFLDEALPKFGDFQDAMLIGKPFLYHAYIAQYLNCGLLDPMKVCQAVDSAFRAGRVPLNCAEGFIRQIIGWREYVRGIYWLNMPGYAEQNHFGHNRPLPELYWTGETDMTCVREAVTQTRQLAYAHHIQRLMVTGNFALLAGVDPHAVHLWYLSVYADAYEWVELPNTVGMSQFADGGLLASKPYVSSGAYINRMSNYCVACRYDVKQRTGPEACPFNSLFWDFLSRHRPKLEKNPRLAQMYRTFDRFPDTERGAIAETARSFLETL